MTSLRNGIRHFRDLTIDELMQWCTDGVLDCTVTEKTDGMAFAIGWDERIGIYTRTAHSPKTYISEQYRARAIQKFGDRFNPAISDSFIEAHKLLVNNRGLVDFVTTNKTELTGEMFLRSLGETDDLGRIKFVGTWYDLNKIPAQGTFVIHAKVNSKVPTTNVSSRYLKVDDDLVDSEHPPLIKDMTVSEAEIAVRLWLSALDGKWGDEKEGYVLHKSGFLPVKLMNESFYINKRSFS